MILTFGVVGLLGLIAIVTLLYLSWNHTESNTQFFTQNILNLLLLGTVVVQAVIYTYQWISMRDVVRQNERLIRVSQRQARSAENTLKQNKSVVEAAQRQAKAAEDTLMHSRDSLIDSERAYMGIKKIELMSPFVADENPLIKVYVVNGGRTPARNIRPVVGSYLNDMDHPSKLLRDFIRPKDDPLEVVGRIGILPANVVDEDSEPRELPGWNENTDWPTALPRVKSGEVPFYVLVSILFTDFQNRTREFRSISFYNDETGSTFLEADSLETLEVAVTDFATVTEGLSFDIRQVKADNTDNNENPN